MSDLVGIGILLALMYLAHQLSRSHSQNQEILFRLNKLLERQGIEIGRAAEPSAKVRELAYADGAEIEAIKEYRKQTGLGLKEARAVVQALSSTRGDA
jgi:ribosomal protein L7/L12